MSTHTTNPATEPQSQTPEQPLPVAVPEPAPAETPEPVVPTEGTAQQPPAEQAATDVAAAKEAAEAAAAEAEQAARDEANATLKQCSTAYRRGEREYRKGLLEAGGHAARYIQQRLALGDKRDAAVDLLTLELSRYSSTTVVVNDMVGAYWAYQLLAVEQGLDQSPGKGKPAPADAVVYGAWRDEWSRLTVRTTTKGTETWTLLPGVEEEARTLFATMLQREVVKVAAVRDHVNNVVLKARQVAEQAVRDEKARLQAAAEQAARKAEADRKRAAELQQQANQLRASGDKQAAAAVEEQVVATVLQANQATKEAEVLEAKVEQAEVKEAKAQEATQKAARKLEPKPDAKPAPKLQAPPAGTPPAGGQPPLPSKPAPILSAPVGAVELGCECADVIAECDAPEDALEALLEKLLRAGVLSKSGDRAVRLALAEMHRPSKASNPTEAPLVAAS